MHVTFPEFLKFNLRYPETSNFYGSKGFAKGFPIGLGKIFRVNIQKNGAASL